MTPDTPSDDDTDGDGATASLDLTDGRSIDWFARSREQMGVETEEDYRELREQGRKELVENAALAGFAEGDVVDTPDGIGVVSGIVTENKETDAEGFDNIEASPSSPTYIVVSEEDTDSGISVFDEDEIERGEIETDVNPLGAAKDENSDEEADAAVVAISELTPGDGRFEYPESWQESETPNRVIALKAFAGMGGSFDGCVREMTGSVSAPDRFCADFIDRVLGNPYWRGDSPLPGD